MRIAIIGGAVAGLTCAYLLHRRHDVTIFEASSSLGGIRQMAYFGEGSDDQLIDLGFCLFSAASSPNFHDLLRELHVDCRPTDMSVSVSDAQAKLEYGLGSLDALFASRRNLLSPGFWDMLLDIRRFHRESLEDHRDQRLCDQISLRDYLNLCRYGERFIEHYVVPISATVCSLTGEDPLDLPLLSFLRLFGHHSLPPGSRQGAWFRLAGGAQSYIEPLARDFRSRIRLNSRVLGVVRDRCGVTLSTRSGAQRFDKVIFACRSDQALALLERPSLAERLVLGGLRYNRHELILHTDSRLMPRRRRAWATWNYRLGEPGARLPGLTCHLNRLLAIPMAETLCLSLNQATEIDPERILARHSYLHPRHDSESSAGKARADELQGSQHSYFCGSYWGNGQHEDAVASARQVAAALDAPGRPGAGQPQRGLGSANITPLRSPDIIWH